MLTNLNRVIFNVTERKYYYLVTNCNLNSLGFQCSTVSQNSAFRVSHNKIQNSKIMRRPLSKLEFNKKLTKKERNYYESICITKCSSYSLFKVGSLAVLIRQEIHAGLLSNFTVMKGYGTWLEITHQYFSFVTRSYFLVLSIHKSEIPEHI